MTPRTGWLALLYALIPGVVPAQEPPVSVHSAVLYERYAFGSASSVIEAISQLTIPATVRWQIARPFHLLISSGFSRTALATVNDSALEDQEIAAPLDTEFRLSYQVVPGRLILLGTGAVATGRKTVVREELAIIGAVSSDVIGFSSSTLGSGGNLGGGVVAAVPLGRFALGVGATFRQPFGYTPLAGVPERLAPGRELRVRGGLEGPLARRLYVRVAGVYATRERDALDGAPRNGLGNRIIAFASLRQGIGNRGEVTLYAFDVYRGNPAIEASATGAAAFPRGNLLGLGARVTVGLGRGSGLTPHVEYRSAIAAPSATRAEAGMRRTGESLRLGADLRLGLGAHSALVLRTSGFSGRVAQGEAMISVRGFRVGMQLELRP